MLKKEDFIRTARILGCEPAALQAVQKVETGGRGGFLVCGKPTILFEGHIFWPQLKKRGIDPNKYLPANEDILYPKWTKAWYKGGAGEWERLERAKAIHEEAALCSASSPSRKGRSAHPGEALRAPRSAPRKTARRPCRASSAERECSVP